MTLEDHKLTRVSNAVAAGITDINCTGLDMMDAANQARYEGVLFVCALGTLTATQVTKLKVQQSDDDGGSDAYDDLEGSATAAAADGDSNKLLVCDVHRPTKRYVRAVVDRGTANAVVDGVVAVQYHGSRPPSVQSSTVSQSKRVVSPAEGTA